ncbi:MAG: biotin/lipoyl-binding protein [Propioniciclava sp.]|uniref:HlyD family efflux transporter periplasmic adaptor subunit n=1 Tax=Propioniciclava sp. TaxID=2038686 RepID=UPI0039E6E468
MTDQPTPTTPAPLPPVPLPPARVLDAVPDGGSPRVARVRRRRRVVAAVTAGVLVAGGTTWGVAQAMQRGTRAERYTTVEASRGAVTQLLNSSGTVAKVNEMAVRFPAAGRVAEVRAAVGDTVEPGDVLAVLDPEQLRRALLQAQADADAATLALEQAREAAKGGSGTGDPGTGDLGTGDPGSGDPGSGGGSGTPPQQGGGQPVAPSIPAPPDPSVDVSTLEGALAAADAEAVLVAERRAAADAALTVVAQVCPAGTPAPSPSVTPSSTVSPSPTVSPSSSVAPSPTALPSPTATPAPGGSPSPTVSPVPAASPSPSVAERGAGASRTSGSAAKATTDADPEACRAALVKAAEAQASVAEAQARLSAAQERGGGILNEARAAVGGVIGAVQAWFAAVVEAVASLGTPGTPAGNPGTGTPGGGVSPSLGAGAGAGGGAGAGAAGGPVPAASGLDRSSITSAEVAHAKAQRALAAAQDDLEAATLRAPIAGVVSALPFTAGAQASETDQAVITAPGAVQVTIAIPAASFPYVRNGQQATLRASGGAEANASVMSKALVPTDDGYAVTLLSSGSGADSFASGVRASVQIEVSNATDVVVVPLSAVRRTGSDGVVKVLSGHEVTEVPVKLGSIGDSHAEVIEGIAEGDRLVVADAEIPLPGLDFGGPQ